MSENSSLPRHVAIIMDGNGRWAVQRGKPRLEGHRAGVAATHRVVQYLYQHQIEYVTLYAFSSENWSRPAEEINGLFDILAQSIQKESEDLNKNKVRIKHLGRWDGIPAGLVKSIYEAVALTCNNTKMTLALAFNYGGRQEIVDSLRDIVKEAIPPDDINEEIVARHLYTAGMPDVDLLIRTGGEMRISNFLLWQSAYAEYYFTPVLWPDIDEKELDHALEVFSQRCRRFGGI